MGIVQRYEDADAGEHCKYELRGDGYYPVRCRVARHWH